jgi:outer membrane biosynthesis protein TonB
VISRGALAGVDSRAKDRHIRGMFNLRLTAMAFALLGAAGCSPASPAAGPVNSSNGASPEEPAGGKDPSVGSAEPPSDEKEGKNAEQQGGGAATPASSSGKNGATPQNASVVDERALTGSLSKAEIRAIVTKHAELFDECYSIGAGKSTQFVATVTIKATIGPSGVVNETKVLGSNAKNVKVDQCVADAFKKIKFPMPKDGVTSVITFPMEFQGAEQVK